MHNSTKQPRLTLIKPCNSLTYALDTKAYFCAGSHENPLEYTHFAKKIGPFLQLKFCPFCRSYAKIPKNIGQFCTHRRGAGIRRARKTVPNILSSSPFLLATQSFDQINYLKIFACAQAALGGGSGGHRTEKIWGGLGSTLQRGWERIYGYKMSPGRVAKGSGMGGEDGLVL